MYHYTADKVQGLLKEAVDASKDAVKQNKMYVPIHVDTFVRSLQDLASAHGDLVKFDSHVCKKPHYKLVFVVGMGAGVVAQNQYNKFRARKNEKSDKK